MRLNLSVAMARRGVKIKDLIAATGLCQKSVYNKLHGVTPFTVDEAIAIRGNLFPDLPIEWLFAAEREMIC